VFGWDEGLADHPVKSDSIGSDAKGQLGRLNARMKIDRQATSIGLFPSEPTLSAKTAIVFGVARGGTSMVAGAARGLGFYMGHELQNNNEDLEFSYKPLEHMKNVIRARNIQYRKWGWKFPAAANYLDDLLAHVRNPHLIVVCRDIVATSAGHVRWHQRETSFAISDILLQTQKNILLALRWRVPALLVSYEKAALRPGRFVDELSQFLGEPVEVDREKLIAYLAPGKYKTFEGAVEASIATSAEANNQIEPGDPTASATA
jgi:hypothetical protein